MLLVPPSVFVFSLPDRKAVLKVNLKVSCPSLEEKLPPEKKRGGGDGRDAKGKVLSKHGLLGEVFPLHQSSVGVWLPRLVS